MPEADALSINGGAIGTGDEPMRGRPYSHPFRLISQSGKRAETAIAARAIG